MRTPLFITAALLMTLTACLAADHAPLPQELAWELGVTPDVAHRFTLVYREGVAGQGTRSWGDAFRDAPLFETIHLANVAADRWLFKITFTEDYVQDNNTFILYLDVDGDPGTGRQENVGVQGTDLMYVQQDGRFSLPCARGGAYYHPPGHGR